MLRQDEKLTIYEGASLLSLTFLYHIFNEVLPVVVETTGTSAWLSQILSSLLAPLYLLLFYLLLKQYKDKDFLQICDVALGRVLSKLLQTVLLVYLLFYCGVSLNQSVELLQIYAYSEISALEIDLIMMGAVGIFAVHSIKGMGKMVSIFLPFIVATLIFILLMSWNQYDANLIYPILGYGVGPTLLSGFYLSSEFTGLLLMSVFFTAYSDAGSFRKCALWAIVPTSLLYAFTTLCYNMAMPYTAVSDLMVGVLGIAQSNHSNRFMQRMESVFIGITVIAILLLLGIGFLTAKKVYCSLFRIQKQHSVAVIVPLGMIIICIARTMASHLQYKTYMRVLTRRFGVYFMLGLLLPVLLASWLRKWGGGKAAKAAVMLLVPCLLLGGLSGCVHYREPDAEIYPIIMGYDKGAKEKYRITMKFMLDYETDADKQEEKSEDSGETIPRDTVVVEAPSFTEGINLINSTIPKKVSMLHVKMLVMSEELAREGVDGFVSPLIRYNEIKPTMSFVVCRGTAYEFITAEQSTLTDSLQLDMELVLSPEKDTTSYFVVSMADFLNSYKTTYGDAVAMLGAVNQSHYFFDREEEETVAEHIKDTPYFVEQGFLAGELPLAGNSKMELAGMAVFQYDKMVGTLDTRECQVMMMLNNTISTANLTIPDPYDPDRYYVSISLRRIIPVSVSSRVDEDGVAHINIHVPLNASIGVSQNPRADYIQDYEHREELSQYAADILEMRAYALLDKLQNIYNADALQLGRNFEKNLLTIQQWESYNWAEQFQRAEVQVKFSINM